MENVEVIEQPDGTAIVTFTSGGGSYQFTAVPYSASGVGAGMPEEEAPVEGDAVSE